MEYVLLPIPVDRYTAVCALLGGAAPAAMGNARDQSRDTTDAAPKPAAEQSGNGVEASPAAATNDASASNVDAASPSDDGDEIDAHGHRWSAELHASTKGKTKEGLWRMKPGASRPDPLPGYPADTDTGTAAATPSTSATSPAATDQASAPTATEEDDEFAAFRNAAAASDANDEKAAASVPARTYSDADLGALCNQAAVKLGDPTPIKEIIASYIPEGQVAHSRNIPEDKRATFVGEVESKAGIEFAG